MIFIRSKVEKKNVKITLFWAKTVIYKNMRTGLLNDLFSRIIPEICKLIVFNFSLVEKQINIP